MAKSKFWKKFKRNKGALASLGVLVVLVGVAVLAPWIAPHSPIEVHEGQLRTVPFWSEGAVAGYPLGTDDLGRDTFSRLIFGARISLGVGALVVVLSLFIGGLLGLVAGYFAGWIDNLVVGLVDILMSLPSILLAIAVVAVLGPSLMNGVIAVSVVALPGFIRIVRAAVINEKQKLYVDASTSFGASDFRKIFVSILPNCLAPIIVQATLGFSDGILNVAALGFLGLGTQPPTPEWGAMLADARHLMESSPWLVTLPGVCILIVVLCFNILGDGLRDAFDPKLK
jgi:ABC-type dipeptide/oligopeptide/nickel transport system permease subunit